MILIAANHQVCGILVLLLTEYQVTNSTCQYSMYRYVKLMAPELTYGLNFKKIIDKGDYLNFRILNF